jgi:hypothetical protein
MAGFKATGAMSVARQVRSAALLADGRVLVAAGVSADSKPLLSSETYNPRSGKWTPTGVLNSPHEYSVLVATPDGNAIVVGGATKDGDCLMEVWSAATGEWTATTMPPYFTRVDGAWVVGSALLVLCAPEQPAGAMNFVEVNPLDGRIRHLPSPNNDRFAGLTCLLADDRILLTSGSSSAVGFGGKIVQVLSKECEVYDPVASTWTPTRDLSLPHHSLQRSGHYLVALPDGGALVAGGSDEPADKISVVERWSSTTGRWTRVSPLPKPRDGHATALLADGTLLVSGGEGTTGVLSDALLYTPSTELATGS